MPGHPVNASQHCKSHPDIVETFSTTLFYKVAVLQNFPGLLRSILKFLLMEQTKYLLGSSADQDMHIMGNQNASLRPVRPRPPPPSPSPSPFLTSAHNQSASELECSPHRLGVGKQNRMQRNALGRGWVVTLGCFLGMELRLYLGCTWVK